jgi:hypothetical protein
MWMGSFWLIVAARAIQAGGDRRVVIGLLLASVVDEYSHIALRAWIPDQMRGIICVILPGFGDIAFRFHFV